MRELSTLSHIASQQTAQTKPAWTQRSGVGSSHLSARMVTQDCCSQLPLLHVLSIHTDKAEAQSATVQPILKLKTNAYDILHLLLKSIDGRGKKDGRCSGRRCGLPPWGAFKTNRKPFTETMKIRNTVIGQTLYVFEYNDR